MMKNDTPVAMVTGAAKRIGAVTATHLHEAGFRVVVHCHQSQQAASLLVASLNQQRPHSALMVGADLREHSQIQTLMTNVISWAGRLDLLVNNASVFSAQDSDWSELFLCNVQAPYWLSQAAFPHLALTQGSIINITDIHAKIPLRGYAAYCQSKAALEMQTLALAQVFAPKVRVNAVAPGAILWPEGENGLSYAVQTKILDKTLLKRHGDPKYIAQAVLYLATNTFVTGQSLAIDGGRYSS